MGALLQFLLIAIVRCTVLKATEDSCDTMSNEELDTSFEFTKELMPIKSQFIGRVSIADNMIIEMDLTYYGFTAAWTSILHIGHVNDERSPGMT